MRENNIAMLQDTLDILERGSYQFQGQTIPLNLTHAQMEEVDVYLPRDVKRICEAKDFEHVHVLGRCGYGCVNADSYTLARKRTEQFSYELNRKGAKPILVLNLANPVNPGGGVRRGAKAQEEDLCRKSSLMIFDRHAKLKYKYGNRHFWCRGYYVDTVGRNKEKIAAYIRNQLSEDIMADQLSFKEYIDPFTGSKNN